MQKKYTLDSYLAATQKLADFHGLEAFMSDTKFKNARMFKVYLKGNKSPIEIWTILVTDDSVPMIASAEYLLLPAQYINKATQDEFNALIEQEDQ